MALKEWKINNSITEVSSIDNSLELTDIVKKVLCSRGIDTTEKITAFLNNDAELFDPFLLIDMDKAVERINEAIEAQEKIVIYGDYDCDGITATTVLYTYLLSVGADVSFFIPERINGYGLNKQAIDRLHADGVSLIVTVDTGISAIEESEYLNELGIDMVVTDHHQVSDRLPNVCAVVDPHRADCDVEFKNLCGAGVALKLIAALEGGDFFTALEYFSDLVTIGTIADVVSLTSENRTIVKNGLNLIEMTENIGLKALIDVVGYSDKKITSETIAFILAPRINAAGRMGNANLAIELLLCEDEERAYEIAQEINSLNAKRQSEEQKIIAEIDEYITKNPAVLNDRVIVLAGENWHHGVIGIVSARITEKYGKPSVILSIENDIATGSSRSFGNFSLYKALTAVSEYLVKFGGHSQAAGLTISADKIDSFRVEINNYAREHFKEMPKPCFEVDAEVEVSDLTLENAKSLSVLAPYGENNKQPIFMLRQAKIDGVYPLSEDKHIRVKFSKNGESFFAVMFGVSTQRFAFKMGDVVDILFLFDVNEHNGGEYISIKLKDVRPCGFEDSRYFAAKNAFEMAVRDEKLPQKLYERLTPTREEIVFVYKYLKSLKNSVGADDIYLSLYKTKINFGKILSIVRILLDVELIEGASTFGELTIVKNPQKTDLDNSAFLNYLKGR